MINFGYGTGTKVLEGLSKKCIRFTETLMQDLLELDDITNISDENRPLRKKEVRKPYND